MLLRGLSRNFSSISLKENIKPGILHVSGKGRSGELGLGPKTSKTLTFKSLNVFGEKVLDFDSHQGHNLAVTVSGRVFAWGQGKYGQLGFEAENKVLEPVEVGKLAGHKIRRVVCGGYHSMALSEDGSVYSWGFGGSWWSGVGGLGHGDTKQVVEPTKITGLEGVKIIAIAAGQYHSAALSEDGKMYTWGKGEIGRLGHGNNKDVLVPTMIKSLEKHQVKQIACGASHTAAIIQTGQLYTWGKNRSGELGQEALSVFAQESDPWLVDELKDVRISTVSCGNIHTAAVAPSGDFYIWGSAGFNYFTPQLLTPLSPPNLGPEQRVIDISCGFGYTGVVTADGQVFLWGKARKGQLGHNSKSFEREPRKLQLPASIKGLRVVCADGHSLLLLDRELTTAK